MAIPHFQLLLISVLLGAAAAGNFYQDFDIVWGNDHANIQENGGLLTLSLDQTSGSAFQSRSQYLFGKIDMQLKLVPGNSAGTVTAYYMSSKGETWDEIDFEFLGNVTGEPYILHTNVFCQGKGGREMQFYLWFDPTTDFHNYTILWTPQRIVFYVDGIPIREYKNLESNGIPYPNSQAMRVYSTLWNADNWATRGGLVKTDWTQAPFVATYRNFKADACVMSWGQSYCSQDSDTWMWELIDYAKQGQMQWVHDNYLVYNYCTDYKRFAADGLPPECSYSLDN